MKYVKISILGIGVILLMLGGLAKVSLCRNDTSSNKQEISYHEVEKHGGCFYKSLIKRDFEIRGIDELKLQEVTQKDILLIGRLKSLKN